MTQIYILILITGVTLVGGTNKINTNVIRGFDSWSSCGAAVDKAKKSEYVKDAFCIAQDKY